jgi:hypothetical protein
LTPAQSALHDPLRAIGFDDAAILRIVSRYKPSVVQVWADITLAAMERSPGFFKVSPQAYFMDSLEKAARGTRTPPDWWYEHRKEAERLKRESERALFNLPARDAGQSGEDRAFDEDLRGEGQVAFAEIVGRLCACYKQGGQSLREASRNATEAARVHMRHRFRKEHPEFDLSAPKALGDILKEFKIQ